MQIQHGIEGSNFYYFPQYHVLFVLLYLINIFAWNPYCQQFPEDLLPSNSQNVHFLTPSRPVISSWRFESTEYEVNRSKLRTTLNFAVWGKFPMR